MNTILDYHNNDLACNTQFLTFIRQATNKETIRSIDTVQGKYSPYSTDSLASDAGKVE